MTLQEVRHYLQTLYSSSSDSSDHKERSYRPKPPLIVATDNKCTTETNNTHVNRDVNCVSNANGRTKKSTFLINIKNKKVKDSCDNVGKQINISQTNKPDKRKKTPAKLFSFKQTLCNMFRFKRFLSPEHVKCDVSDVQEKTNYISNASLVEEPHNNISSRALPPLPLKEEEEVSEEPILDFATSIQRVKDYGWYWGPLPSEVAEKILSNEPDGSFIVRDSSDDHYIFSLTFKLNNCVRHVRIDHDQGTACRTKFSWPLLIVSMFQVTLVSVVVQSSSRKQS
jgi:suppressor of cytokine signaling 7